MEEEEKGAEGCVSIIFQRRLGNVVLNGHMFCVSRLGLVIRKKGREDTGWQLAITGTMSMPPDSAYSSEGLCCFHRPSSEMFGW